MAQWQKVDIPWETLVQKLYDNRSDKRIQPNPVQPNLVVTESRIGDGYDVLLDECVEIYVSNSDFALATFRPGREKDYPVGASSDILVERFDNYEDDYRAGIFKVIRPYLQSVGVNIDDYL